MVNVNLAQYCLFMLTCFNEPIDQPTRPAIVDDLICLSNCNCFYAPSNGINGSDAKSFICLSAIPVLVDQFFNPKFINTLVFKQENFQMLEYGFAKKFLSTISLVLEEFEMKKSFIKLEYVFHIIDQLRLRYLTIMNSRLSIQDTDTVYNLDWKSLNGFDQLEVINVVDSVLLTLDQSFGDVLLPSLHTIIVRNSKLSYVYPEAFATKQNTLQKLIMSKNKLLNLVWLTSGLTVGQFQHLWYLDVSDNFLHYLPEKLSQVAPNLRVLYLHGNRFKTFSQQSIKPWFNIDEFSLIMPYIQMINLNDSYYRLYFTEEMKWIESLNKNKIESLFLVDSLVTSSRYAVNQMTEFVQWDELINKNFQVLDHYPDQIYLYMDGKLYYQNNKMKVLVAVSGEYDSTALWLTKDPLLSRNSPSYTRAGLIGTHTLRVSRLDRLFQAKLNAYRVTVFEYSMLQHLLQQTISSEIEIQIMIGQLVDFLDEAFRRKIYIVLVLWRYDVFDFKGMSSELAQEYQTNLFKNTVMKPLLEQIKRHPALIGLELMDWSFTRYMQPDDLKTKPLGQVVNRCPFEMDSFMKLVEDELRFIEYFANTIQQYAPERLIGLPVSASCVPCWFLATIPACSGFELDFFTIITEYEANDEAYGYLLTLSEKLKLFKLHPMQQDSITKPRGIFYLIQDNDGPLNLKPKDYERLNEASMGYFSQS